MVSSLKPILRAMRHRLLYRFLAFTCVFLVFLGIAIAFDNSLPECRKMMAGAAIGIGYTLLNRPRVSQTREMGNLFYVHYSSEMPAWLRIVNGIGVVILLVSIYFVEAVYLYFAAFCSSFTYMVLIL